MEIPKLDRRSKEDLVQEIQNLARAYVPEWQFASRNLDMGSTAALIFANMMQEVVERYNRTAEKNIVEFFRRLGAYPLRTEPAKAYIQCSVSGMPENVPGEFLTAGVQVLAAPSAVEGEGENLVFTTQQPLYAVNSQLSHVFYEDTHKDRIYHCFEAGAGEGTKRIPLFQPKGENLQSHTLSICGGNSLDLRPGSSVTLTFQFEDTEPEWIRRFFRMFQDGTAEVEYSTEEGFVPARFHSQEGNALTLKLPQTPPAPVVMEGVEGYWISIHFSTVEIPQKIYFKGIGISSRGEKWVPDGIFNDMGQLTVQRFQPFDNSPIPYTSIYFACDSALHKSGSTVKLEFYVDYRREPIHEENTQSVEWKHIMKKSKLEKPKEYDITIRSVVWEYYNGFGWVRLFEDDRYSDVFCGDNDSTMVCITFPCPDDMQRAFLPSGELRCIRARILSVENYLKQYGYYIIPTISQPTFSYWYDTPPMAPYFLMENCMERRLSVRGPGADSVPAAYGRPMVGQSMYFCFTSPLDQPMIRLLFELQKEEKNSTGPLIWEYYTKQGFQPLSCQDDTRGLSQTGLLNLQENQGFVPLTVFQRTGYWLRARVPQGGERGGVWLGQVCLNTVLAQNIQPQEYEYFRVTLQDEKMCHLRGSNVHKAQVYVDELSQVSQATAESWIHQKKAEGQWDADGKLQHLWVLWEEVKDIQQAQEGQRCYQLDRDSSQVRFGNGLAGKIPPENSSENIRISYTVGGGRRGNLPVGAICVADRNLGMISQVTNPMPSFGGQDRETMDQTLLRSSAKLRCFGRACTAFDYEWVARMTQRDILKIRCLSCVNQWGQREHGAVTLVLLLDDMDHFNESSQKIRRRLLELGCGTLRPEKLSIVPPTFLVYHITGQVVVSRYEHITEVQNQVTATLREYFHPLTGGNEQNGWQIGHTPNRMMLRNLMDDCKEVVRAEQFALRVCLESGEELTESDLEQLEARGMVLAKPGEIHIHVRTEE